MAYDLKKMREGCKTVLITQNSSDLRRNIPRRRRPAFQDWINRLKPGERLPRGRFFVGKKPGRSLVFFDELHSFDF